VGQLEDIQVFIRIVEAKGIGKAADQLNMAKSAVSRRLADLESRLSTKLIQRTTRTLNLTEAGQLYYQNALKVLGAVDELNHLVHTSEQALTGTLRIALPLSFGLLHLTPVLDQFAKLHPELSLKLDFSDREVDMIEEGVDLAFRIGELKDASIQARKIVPIHFALCASADYLNRAGLPKTPEELKQHMRLSYSVDQNRPLVFVGKNGEKHTVSMPSQLQANNGEFLLKMAVAGHGIVFLPTFIAWQAIKEGQLQTLLEDYSLPVVHAYAIYPQNRFLSQKARVFIDYLVSYFTSPAYWDKALAKG